MLGPLLGGTFVWIWGVADGVRYAFVAALAFAVIAMVLQQLLIEDRERKDRTAEANPWRLWEQMHADLRNLLLSDILIRFCERIPDSFVVIWATNAMVANDLVSLGKAAFLFGVLRAVEHVTAVLCYIPVAHMADRFGKKPFVAITFGFFTLFPILLFFCASFWPLVIAFVVRGLKEFGEPTRKALIMDLSPEDRKAAMFGLYYLLRDVVVSVAAFGGSLLWMIPKVGPRVNLITACAFGVIGTTWFILRGRDLSAPPAA
jgi:MFS family permease